MFVDVIGLLLTIIIVSPRYWITVLSICFVDLALTVLISITLESNIIGVTAGGIFTSFVGFNNKNLFQLFGPFLYLLFGIGLHKDKKIPWLDLINPFSDFCKPIPILMIKTAIFRILIISLLGLK
ncbi:MAG: hypothetical protein PHE70_06970 [Tepidanaerobacteraceae bacterium]|nr:hypothetical protein [Tepidanaerobacteraceae bacterium]